MNRLSAAGSAMIVLGLVLCYLAFFGRDLATTQTYRYLAEYLPSAIDLYFSLDLLAALFSVLLLVTAGTTKLAAIRATGRSRIVRRLVLISSISVLVPLSGFLLAGFVFRSAVVLYHISDYFMLLPLLFTTAVALAVFVHALFIAQSEAITRALMRSKLLSLLLAGLLLVLAVAQLELVVSAPELNQQLAPTTIHTSSPTHCIAARITDLPNNLDASASSPMTLTCQLNWFDGTDRPNRFPIQLDPTHQYAAVARVTSTGVKVSGPGQGPDERRHLAIDSPQTWRWIISPEVTSAGTIQFILIDVLVYDQTANHLAFEAPITTIRLEVSTPLGLPPWLVAPHVAIGTVLGGLLSLLAPWLLQEFVARRARQQPKVLIP